MKRKHMGSRFEDFLAEEGILEECRATAIKFKIARELKQAMNQQTISKAEMARRLKPAGAASTVCSIRKTRPSP